MRRDLGLRYNVQKALLPVPALLRPLYRSSIIVHQRKSEIGHPLYPKALNSAAGCKADRLRYYLSNDLTGRGDGITDAENLLLTGGRISGRPTPVIREMVAGEWAWRTRGRKAQRHRTAVPGPHKAARSSDRGRCPELTRIRSLSGSIQG